MDWPNEAQWQDMFAISGTDAAVRGLTTHKPNAFSTTPWCEYFRGSVADGFLTTLGCRYSSRCVVASTLSPLDVRTLGGAICALKHLWSTLTVEAALGGGAVRRSGCSALSVFGMGRRLIVN